MVKGNKKLVCVSGRRECCVCFNRILGKVGKLPCGHDNLCVDCIIKVFTANVKCPTCRWVPIKQGTVEERTASAEEWAASAEEWTAIATARLLSKCDEGRNTQAVNTIVETLKLFHVDMNTENARVICANLARNLHYETDSESDD